MPKECGKLEESIRKVVQRISNAGLEESKSLYCNSQVVVVGSEIFSKFIIPVSFSLR
jgi:hypothetical protein